MNRISTAQSFSQASFHISRLQQRSSALSEQIASGMRVQRASDDPLASALGEQAYTRMRREESTQRALSNGRAALQDVDGVLNTATETINQARGRVGSYLQREESASQWSRDIQSSAKNRYSDLVETDMPQAIMELQKNNVVQQAALQTYAQVQKMSLFNYL